jgi:uncharacterized membrane protein
LEGLDIVVTRWDIMDAKKSVLEDDLQSAQPSPWQHRAAQFGRGATWAALVVLAGFALLFSGVLSDLLKESWKAGLQAWAAANSLELILLAGGVILLGGLLAWGAEVMRGSIGKK